MTTITDAPAAQPAPTVNGRLSFARLLRAEWIKFFSVRSTWWTLGLVAFISVGLSWLQGLAMASYTPGGMGTQGMAVSAIIFSTLLTQLMAVILGTIMVTGEYSTGMIRSTLTAEPRRLGSLLAKAVLVATTMFVFALVVFAIASLLTTPMITGGLLDLSDTDVTLMPILGAALYLALMSVMGVGIGFIVRNGPGALAIGIVLVFVAPVLAMFFMSVESFQWVRDFASYLPSNAGMSLYMGQGMSGNPLETVPALFTIIAWAVGALIGGALVLRSRDA